MRGGLRSEARGPQGLRADTVRHQNCVVRFEGKDQTEEGPTMPTKATKSVAKKKKTRKAASRGAAAKSASGLPILDRFRKEAESFEKKLRTSADRTIRQLETQFLHQVHAATEDQVKQLERRVSALEKTVEEYDRRVRGLGVM